MKKYPTQPLVLDVCTQVQESHEQSTVPHNNTQCWELDSDSSCENLFFTNMWKDSGKLLRSGPFFSLILFYYLKNYLER